MDYGREFLRPVASRGNLAEAVLVEESQRSVSTYDGKQESMRRAVSQDFISPASVTEPLISTGFRKTHFQEQDLESDILEGFDQPENFEDNEEPYDDFFYWGNIEAGVEAWETITATSLTGRQFHKRQSLRANIAHSMPPSLSLTNAIMLPWEFTKKKFDEFGNWIRKCHEGIQKDRKLLMLCIKASIAIFLLSPLCVLGPPYERLSTIGAWAIVTVDCVFESNVGLALSKGVNRVIGTFLAGALAVLVNHIGPLLGWMYPYFVVFCCSFFTLLLTFYKYKAPFKDRWNYAVVMALITFHILVLSGYSSDDHVELLIVPLSRLAMIVLGFAVVTVINIMITPAYAGDALHALVAKNFDTAATILEKCIEEYVKGTTLPQDPDEWSRSIDGEGTKTESLPKLYQSIVQSDVEVDKLLATVRFEPFHGKFFYGYPWHLYDDITDHLRYAMFDIIGLDSCLRAEIQAPTALRKSVGAELRTISKYCARTLRKLGESMVRHSRIDASSHLRKAEEAALLLQHKLCKLIPDTLSMAATVPAGDLSWVGQLPSSVYPHEYKDLRKSVDLSNSAVPSLSSTPDDGFTFHVSNSQKGDVVAASPGRESKGTGEWGGRHRMSVDFEDNPSAISRQSSGRTSFLVRQDSLQREWVGTVERISALSLVKFVSLVLEIVAKLKFVVESIDELAVMAKFEA